jgi:hypothetical protein
MKHFSFITFLSLLVLFSCTKEGVVGNKKTYLQNVKTGLRDSLDKNDFSSLDFKKAIISVIDSANLYYLRIPFKDKKISSEFILLQTDNEGHILKGKIINIEGQVTRGMNNKFSFDGVTKFSSLNKKQSITSAILSGKVQAFHSDNRSKRVFSMPGPDYKELDEVVVYATMNSWGEGSWGYGIWFSLAPYLSYEYGGTGYTDGGYYGDLTPTYADGGGGGGSSAGTTQLNESTDNPGLYEDIPVYLDLDYQSYLPGIDLDSYLKCFDNIPNEGAKCSIEIYTDIPIDSDPYKLIDVTTANPGHTFLQIKKSNGSQSVVQNIGFYPSEGWKVSISNAPVDGKFADNGGHEMNAALLMNLTPEKLNSAITEIKNLAKFIKYDIDEYNCTDFALDVFNKVRSEPLEIPLYQIPGGITAAGTRTPQGLYNKLKSMKASNHPEAGNITVVGYKGWVAYSSGKCN